MCFFLFQVRTLQDKDLVPVSAEVLLGPLVSEVRLHFTDEAQLTVRCADLCWLAVVAAECSSHHVCN